MTRLQTILAALVVLAALVLCGVARHADLTIPEIP